jgi:SAM-dependent methyltransferase
VNLRQFWSHHDETLVEHESLQQVALSHDLYRGMPAWFNAYYAHFQQRAVMRLLHRCGPLDGARVLDVGCGTGRWSELLAAVGACPVGVDIGLRALRLAAQRQINGCFSAAELPYLGFANGVFDLVLSVLVLQHVPRTQQREAIAALARVLRPGGWLIACELVDPADPADHVFANSSEVWFDMFGAAGLRRLAYVPCEYLPYVKWFQRAREWIGSHRPSGSVTADVSSVAMTLQRRPALAWMLQATITLSYPLEYLASWFLPRRWARLGGFLLLKE